MEKVSRKIIGITMGDPCGIGPEVVLKAMASKELSHEGPLLIIGSEAVLRETAKGLKLPLEPEGRDVEVLDLDNFDLEGLGLRAPSKEAGKASLEYIFRGIDLALRGDIGALVTAPISKEAIRMAGYPYSGHTSILKELTGAPRAVMMMLGGNLRVSFVTIHIPLKEVPALINTEDILSAIRITTRGLRELFSISKPRLVVCALNPHAGEGGLMGSEEEEIVLPAVMQAQEEEINCVGPMASDVAFYKASQGEFDAVVSLYHDQGTIPIKLLAFQRGVNLTLGISIVRTSPTHGTAFDIAGKGIADPGSMLEAIKVAGHLSRLGRPLVAYY